MDLYGAQLDFLAAFFGGVLVSFTPCVYPLIPVAAGYIGVTSQGNRLKGFFLGLCYVAGLAAAYSVLGMAAALGGVLFGSFSSSPAAHLFAGGMIIFFGLAMLDLFTLPSISAVKAAPAKKGGYFSAFLLGGGSSLIAAPCLSPVLGSILAYIATRQHLFYGAALLFSFALGVGLLLLLVSVFSSGIIEWLPKAGKWMVYIKRVCAAVLIIMGLYFIYSGIRRI